MKPEIWVIEYSLKQKAFHIEELSEACKTNIMTIKGNKELDYLPVYYTTSLADANKIIDKIKDLLR